MTPTVPCNNGSIMKIRYFKISEHNYDNVVRRDVISIYMLREDGWEYRMLDGHNDCDSSRARWFDPEEEGDTPILEFIENRKDDSCEITKEKALEIALLEL